MLAGGGKAALEVMKPMAKKTLIMKSSALCENIKVTALTQEVACLSKNTCELVDIETRTDIIDTFTSTGEQQRGWGRDTRRSCWARQTDSRCIRKGKWRQKTEVTGTHTNIRIWRPQHPVVSVLFVPKTWGSVLQKRLQELEPM